MVLAAYFVSSLERGSVTDQATRPRAAKSVEVAKDLARGLGPGADDDAVGTEELLDRRPFLEKLRVRDDLELDLALRVEPRLDRVARADGHRALDDGQRGLLCGRRDAIGDREDGADVGRSVGPRRRAHRDEVRVGLVEGSHDLGGEAQAPGPHVAAHQIGEARLVDRDGAALELANAFGVDVDAQDLVAQLREPGPRDETHVADAERDELHGLYVAAGRFQAQSQTAPGRGPHRHFATRPASASGRPGLG